MAPDHRNAIVNATGASVEECEALLRRVVDSAPFKRSARLRELLLYVGDQGIRCGVVSLHEHQIGETVFGRSPEYDTAQDNIVRVNATELRKRVDQYFSGDGRNEPLVFEIPRGRYTPVFHERLPEALDDPPPPLSVSTSSHATDDDQPHSAMAGAHAVAEEARGAPTVRASDRTKLSNHLLVTLVLCLIAAGALLTRQARDAQSSLHPWQRQPALRAFWSNFFDKDEQVDLLLADVSYGLAQDLTHQRLSLDDYLDYSYRQVQSPGHLSPEARLQQQKDLGFILARSFGSVGDYRAAMRLRSLENTPGAMRLVFARDYSASELRQRTTIILGSRRSNPWADLFENQMEYKFDFYFDGTQSVIRIDHPQKGEKAEYPWAPNTNERTGYCIIAFLPNLTATGNTLMIAGTDAQATEAGGEFLSREDTLQKLLKLTGRSSFPHFQVLLRTRRLSGAPLGSEIISYRINAQ